MIWRVLRLLSKLVLLLGKRQDRAEELNEYVETRKRMDEVDAGDDPAVLREWLRERGKR
jgi:hypothetical protein